MWQISLILFLLFLCSFIAVMCHDSRTLLSGFTLVLTMIGLLGVLIVCFSYFSNAVAENSSVLAVLVILVIITSLCIFMFPFFLVCMFFIEGIKIIKHEGRKTTNLLSVIFAFLLGCYVFIWPIIRDIGKNKIETGIYLFVNFTIMYMLFLMAVYSLSAFINLIHFKKRKKADYIVVLGAGIIGKRVTPLLAARIEKGIELLKYNPDAMLIMSGGQGPGEDMPESEAMAAYAVDKGVNPEKIIMEKKSVSTEENLKFSRKLMTKENPRIIVVTTAYHVFRALILAKEQQIKCIGYGAKTKWYFTLNAWLREFAGYMSITWKKHLVLVIVFAVIFISSYFMGF